MFKEKQYLTMMELLSQEGRHELGIMQNQVWHEDPRRLCFVLSRYKFVSKMLAGKSNVLEVGCGDGWASRVVAQNVDNLSLCDFDPVFIDLINSRPKMQNDAFQFKNCFVHDFSSSELKEDEKYDAVYACDVLEHVDKADEAKFLKNICKCLTINGVGVFGIPSLESQQYASEQSKVGHVNCKTGADFQSFLQDYFCNVFLFSMNDEVIHTGFHPMAHYLFALCCAPK